MKININNNNEFISGNSEKKPTLEAGQIVVGTVKNITDFGAFIDFKGGTGLLYITDMSWGRIKHPSEMLAKNDTITVVILDLEDKRKRVSLGLKQLTPNPWTTLSDLNVGDIVKGKIVNILDYGVFIEVKPGIEGLVHITEMAWQELPKKKEILKTYFKKGDEVEAKIMKIDYEERKMLLSIKQLLAEPKL